LGDFLTSVTEFDRMIVKVEHRRDQLQARGIICQFSSFIY